jgi:hypothetical protein
MMTESKDRMTRLIGVREHFAQLPGTGKVMLERNYVSRDKCPKGLLHPNYGSLTMRSAELVVTHVNGRDEVVYEVNSQGTITGARVGRVQRPRTSRERLKGMPTPTNAMEALTVLLTASEVALDEGRATTEDVQTVWREISDDLRTRSQG